MKESHLSDEETSERKEKDRLIWTRNQAFHVLLENDNLSPPIFFRIAKIGLWGLLVPHEIIRPIDTLELFRA